jgi:hypothetical protein
MLLVWILNGLGACGSCFGYLPKCQLLLEILVSIRKEITGWMILVSYNFINLFYLDVNTYRCI